MKMALSGAISSQCILSIKDCVHLLTSEIAELPGGYTKSGFPLMVFPDNQQLFKAQESDILLLLKYLISITPRTGPTLGFALLIDRKSSGWEELQQIFSRILTIFPAKIREVFLLYHYPAGKPRLGQLMDDYLLDFDIFHVSHVSELSHYIDAKHLPTSFAGTLHFDVEKWILIQELVDDFTIRSTKIAQHLSAFVKLLNQEDVFHLKNKHTMKEVTKRNRRRYNHLNNELDDLTEDGSILLHDIKKAGANLMQTTAIQLLIWQLENTWKYFTRTFKIQDHLYVQHVELEQFQTEFRDLKNKFCENERIIRKIIIRASNIDEIRSALKEFEVIYEALVVDVNKARKLEESGRNLMKQHQFTKPIIEPRVEEITLMCENQEDLFSEIREPLLVCYDVLEDTNTLRHWCKLAEELLRLKDTDDSIYQLETIEKLDKMSWDIRLSKENLDIAKRILPDSTIVKILEASEEYHAVLNEVMERKKQLEADAEKRGTTISAAKRKQYIMTELLQTEQKYVEDLQSVLFGYRDVLLDTEMLSQEGCQKIFSNLDEIERFHSTCVLPRLQDNEEIAKIFLDCSEVLKNLYCSYCQNMSNALKTISQIGESHPALVDCQQNLGHNLPLSSYLLKPVQRLTKYHLLLKDLQATSVNTMNTELDDCVAEILGVVRVVNDSLNQLEIKGLPDIILPLGSYITKGLFNVLVENKSQSQTLFRNKQQKRCVLLYENQMIFCKNAGCSLPGLSGSRTGSNFQTCLQTFNGTGIIFI